MIAGSDIEMSNESRQQEEDQPWNAAGRRRERSLPVSARSTMLQACFWFAVGARGLMTAIHPVRTDAGHRLLASGIDPNRIAVLAPVRIPR